MFQACFKCLAKVQNISIFGGGGIGFPSSSNSTSGSVSDDDDEKNDPITIIYFVIIKTQYINKLFICLILKTK